MDEDLEHGILSALFGTKRKNHKYIKREGSPGKYRYFYPPSEKSKQKMPKAQKKPASNGLLSLAKPQEPKYMIRTGSAGNYTYYYADTLKNMSADALQGLMNTAGVSVTGAGRAFVQKLLGEKLGTKVSDFVDSVVDAGKSFFEQLFGKKKDEETVTVFSDNNPYSGKAEDTKYDWTTADYEERLDRLQDVANDANPHYDRKAYEVYSKYADLTTEEYYNLPKKEREAYVRALASLSASYAAGWGTNCMLCTLTYELSQRGIDAEAGPRLDDMYFEYLDPKTGKIEPGYVGYPDGLGVDATIVENQIWAPDSVNVPMVDLAPAGHIRNTEADARRLVDSFLDNVDDAYPDGARGNLTVYWDYDHDSQPEGGHSMAWEMVGDQFIVIDCQTGVVYDTPDKIANMMANADPTNTNLTRLDNVDIDMAAVAERCYVDGKLEPTYANPIGFKWRDLLDLLEDPTNFYNYYVVG